MRDLDVNICFFKGLGLEGLPLHVTDGFLVEAHPPLKLVILRHDEYGVCAKFVILTKVWEKSILDGYGNKYLSAGCCADVVRDDRQIA